VLVLVLVLVLAAVANRRLRHRLCHRRQLLVGGRPRNNLEENLSYLFEENQRQKKQSKANAHGLG